MDTNAKILEVFENAAKNFIKMQKSITKSTNPYEFEKQFKEKMHQFEQIVL